ncbi:MAG: hypothetical protein JKX76_00640 [Colwellia sp.]|nr:hypothetical protein [Colwellia sp.]
MAVRSKNTIFNAVLLRVGFSEASEGSGLWQALEANYDDIVRAAFEIGDGVFPFGRKHITLVSRADGNFGFDDSFLLLNSVIHVIEVHLDRVSCSDLQEPWEIDGEAGALLVNAGTRKVQIDAVIEGLEHTWSSAFTSVIKKRLEAVIKDVLEESEESAAKDQDADFLMLQASVKSAKNRSHRRFWKKGRGRLLMARGTRSNRRRS